MPKASSDDLLSDGNLETYLLRKAATWAQTNATVMTTINRSAMREMTVNPEISKAIHKAVTDARIVRLNFHSFHRRISATA